MAEAVSVNICMGTGGMAAGGAEVMAAFHAEFERLGVEGRIEKNCATHQVGCRGFCARDVLVDVAVEGQRSTYQVIKPSMVPRIVEEHVIGGTPVAEWLVGSDYHDFHDRQVKVVLLDCGRIDPENIEDYVSPPGAPARRSRRSISSGPTRATTPPSPMQSATNSGDWTAWCTRPRCSASVHRSSITTS